MKVILLFSYCLIQIISYFCNHDEYIKQNPPKIANSSLLLRSKMTSDIDYHPIRIYVDYTSIKNIVSNVSDEYIENYKIAISSVISMLEKLVMINNTDKVNFNTRECNINFTFSQEILDGVDYDLVIIPIFLTPDELGNGTLASARFCYLDPDADRPTGGQLNLGIETNFSLNNSQQFTKMILFHEITHVLGFSSYFFKKYQSSFGNVLGEITVNGVTRKILKTPKVVEAARKHFNCSTLEGIELEDQGVEGSFGSHWEARIMLGDYMISTRYDELVISDITLAFLEDLGWYKVNYYTGGLFRFGKGEGCEFLNSKCIINEKANFNEEFCDIQNESLCFSGNSNKGECIFLKYDIIPEEYKYFSSPKLGGFQPVDYCPVARVRPSNETYLSQNCKIGSLLYTSSEEVIGDNSICVNTINQNISKAMCFRIKCDYSSKTILIEVLGKQITCKNYGENITINSDLIIKCPRFTKVCSGSVWCNEPEECINLKSTLIDYDTVNNINNNNIKLIIIIVSLLIGMILGGLIVYFCIRNKKENNSDKNNESFIDNDNQIREEQKMIN